MPRFDMPLDELRRYAPELEIPADFDAFWTRTIDEARAVRRDPEVTQVATALSAVEVRELAFPGFAGDQVLAWYLRPAGVAEPLPTVVEFVGYGGGRGFAHERLTWANSGYAYVVMDTRGQGSPWAAGRTTADPHGTGPSVTGFVTRGVESAENSYYRRVFTDAVRCVDAVAALPGVRADQIVACGTSQGGGIGLAVAGLHAGIAAALIDVPFLCDFPRAVQLTDRDPGYGEIARYLAIQRGMEQAVQTTLSYLDGANLATRATAPALFSVGLLDTVCPPSTVFGAFNRYGGAKSIDVYPYNGHEGGGPERWPAHAAFVERVLGNTR